MGRLLYSGTDVSVTANTNIFPAAGIVATRDSKNGVLHVQFDTAGILTVVRVDPDLTEHPLNYNLNSNLTADALYQFDIIIPSFGVLNLKYSSTANAEIIEIMEE